MPDPAPPPAPEPTPPKKAGPSTPATKSEGKRPATPATKSEGKRPAQPQPAPAAPAPAAAQPAPPAAPAAAERPAEGKDKKKKPGTKSETKAAKRPRGVAPAKGGPPMVAIAGALAVAAGAGIAVAVYVAQMPPPQPPAPPAPPTPTAPAPDTTPAPAVPTRTVLNERNDKIIASALRELGAGRERVALELLDAAKASPEVDGVRERILTRSRETLKEESQRLKEQARKGRDTATLLARLRTRLPESFKAELDELAIVLRKLLPPIPRADDEEEPLASADRPRRRTVDEEEPEPEPEPLEPEPEPEPEEEPEPLREPGPRGPSAGPGRGPAPRPTEPEPEPPVDDDPPPRPAPSEPDGPSEEEKADEVMKAALRELLHTSFSLNDGVVDMTYTFDGDAERQDFDLRGFDKAEVNKVHGVASGHTGQMDLELGAGSRGTGKLMHCVDLAGDYEVDMTMWTAHSGGRSQFFIVIGKVAVRWGEQLLKVSGSGMKPLSPEPDRMQFREERDVNIRIARQGDTITVTLNGRTVASKSFTPAELDGRVAVVISDVRIVISNLRIKGKVDARKL